VGTLAQAGWDEKAYLRILRQLFPFFEDKDGVIERVARALDRAGLKAKASQLRASLL
jgi:hypothetical protein